MLGADNLRLLAMTFTSCGRSMMSRACGATFDPQWRLLKNQLETKGPGWCSLEREERLFTNKSNRPGNDMKDALRTERPCGVFFGQCCARHNDSGSHEDML